jgi:MFS family permease
MNNKQIENIYTPDTPDGVCINDDLREKLLSGDGDSSSQDDNEDFFTLIENKNNQENHEITIVKFDFNKAMEIIGDFNFYQIYSAIFLGIIWLSIPSVPIMIPFYRMIPDYTCLNSTNNTFHKCSVEEYCDISNNRILNPNFKIKNWETDFQISCKNSIYYGLLASTYFLGILFGFIFVSNCSNKYGRKKVLVFFLYFYLIISLMMNFYSNIFTLFIYLFFIGIIYSGTTMCAFILIFESTSKNYKAILSTIISMSFGLGALINILLFYYIRNWKILLGISSIVCLILILASYKIQESPEYLFNKKKYNLLREVFENIARMNNKEIELRKYLGINQLKEEENNNENFYNKKDMEENIKYSKNISEPKLSQELKLKKISETEKNLDALTIITLSKYRFKLLLMAFNWFTMTLTFYGINFSLNNFGMNVFVTGLVVYSSEVIAQFISMFLIMKIGDKNSIIASYIFSAISLIILQILNSPSIFGLLDIRTAQSHNTTNFYIYSMLKIFLIFSAKFGISSISNVNYIYTGRIFNTESRMGAMSFCKIISRLGAVSSTLLIEISDYSMVIFGSFCIITAFLINVYGNKLEKI